MTSFINPDIQFATNQKIKVLINDTSSVFEAGHKDRGMLYDIWKNIREQLKDKYTFEEEIVKIKNYNKLIDMIDQGEADLAISPFQVTSDRSKKVDFTMTILESKDSIIYIPKFNKLELIKQLIKTVFLGPLLILFIFGFLTGVFLYFMEPKRFPKSMSKSMSLRRSIVITTSTLFGEAGSLSEETTLSIKGIITLYLIMVFAFFFVTYVQAAATEKVLDIRELNTIDRDNIHTKTLLAPKGYSIAKNIERLGAKIKYVENKSLDDVIDMYVKDPSIADGVAIDYLQAKTREDPSIQLIVNESNLGFKEITFAVSKNRVELLRDINQKIVELQDNMQTETICKSYMPPGASYLCVK